MLLFADRTRAEARAAVNELRALGLGRQVLLTGDREAVVRRIGAELGIGEVVAGALPEQRMDRVLAEIRAGFRPLVVGDGINDSLALKAGAVGVAMGAQGTDVAPGVGEPGADDQRPPPPRHRGPSQPPVPADDPRQRGDWAGPDGKPVVLGEGGRLGPFTVMAVRPDGVDLSGPPGFRTLRPSGDAALRPRSTPKPSVLALIDPDRREAETENDQ